MQSASSKVTSSIERWPKVTATISGNRDLRGQKRWLFDHLVGAGEQGWRHFKAERPCGRHVDHKLKLGRLQHRQVRGFRAREYAANIDAHLTERICDAGVVAH